VGISALFIAGSAAFFSVFGLSKLFAGEALAVIIMAGSLEFGKLVAASFLYRYWSKLVGWLKIYMTVGVITLVMITSAGIFGFLSNAYQGATIDFEKQTATLFYKEDRLNQLQEDKVYLKDELEQSVNALPDNYPTAKRQLREEYNPKVLEINTEILDIKQDISDLKVELVETGVDVGPAIYLARAFGSDVDTVTKFFIFILIFVFDPMAVALVIAFNIANSSYSDITVPRKKRKGIRRWAQHGEKKIKVPVLSSIFTSSDEDSYKEEIRRNWTSGSLDEL
jgi:hypothetical protein|tara:strand:+ start:2349 stop:3191 length:843 start_codon:yes stop_codon:yes gene_type:complete